MYSSDVAGELMEIECYLLLIINELDAKRPPRDTERGKPKEKIKAPSSAKARTPRPSRR